MQPGKLSVSMVRQFYGLFVPAGAVDNDSEYHVPKDLNLTTVGPCRMFIT